MIMLEKMIAHVILGILLFFEGLSNRGWGNVCLCKILDQSSAIIEKCDHSIVYVEDITQHTAMLYWKRSGTEEVRDYKVMCAGVRQYMTVAGEREVDLDTVTQYIPHGVGHAFLSPLQSNFNYSCVVESESSDVKQQTRPLLFSTPYSAPEIPRAPVIASADDGREIVIKLFTTSTKYGPIDGYEVQFHILDDHTAHVHGQPDLPPELTQPKGLLSSMDTARSSKHPLPFCTAFRNSTLPTLMLISDNLLQGAIRTDTTYTIITVAYTDNYEEISRPLLYSMSPPSKPFSLLITSDELVAESTLSWLEKMLLKWSMAVGVIISNIFLLYFLLVGCCLLHGYISEGREPPDNNIDLIQQGSAMKEMRAAKDGAGSAETSIMKSSLSYPVSDNGASQLLKSEETITADLCNKSAEVIGLSVAGIEEIISEEKIPQQAAASVTCGQPPDLALQICITSSKSDVLGPAHVLEKSSQVLAQDEGPEAMPLSRRVSDDDKMVCNEPHHSAINSLSSLQLCESSLVFLPRGLSHGPLPMSTSQPSPPPAEHSDPPTTDLAPDLEMDLYGISYSLDETLDH